MEKFLCELYLYLRKLRKAVAVSVCLSLTLSSAAVAAHARDYDVKTENLRDFSIPASLGRIVAAKYFGDDEIIVNIQDLHCHAETQKNIAEILKHLDKNYELEEIFLEGAFGGVDTSWLAQLNNSEIGSNIIDNLLNFGYLSGAEYYAALNGKNGLISGLENESLYKENIKLLNEIISARDDVSGICRSLSGKINKAKLDYSSAKAKKFDKLVKKYEKGKISREKYYKALIKTAKENGISLDDFKNLRDYARACSKAGNLNPEKISKQLGIFIDEIKNLLPYGQYSLLSEKSGNFSNIENIAGELANLDGKYSVTDRLELRALRDFLRQTELMSEVNPVYLVKEEKELIHQTFLSMGRDGYELEVRRLSEFVPLIEGYFTANITSDELSVFADEFGQFKSLWRSYFSENTAKQLDKYAALLARYHGNNLLRDKIFTEIIINSANSRKKNPEFKDGKEALSRINKNKKFKVIVTGGFHSSGLENIFEQNNMSYVVIMPKITTGTSRSYDIHLGTVKEYGNIERNSINVEPLSQEPLAVSFPKLLAGGIHAVETLPGLREYSAAEKENFLRGVMQDILAGRPKEGVYVAEWEVSGYDKKGIREISVTYKDFSRPEYEQLNKYLLSGSGIERKEETSPEKSAGTREGSLKKLLSVFNDAFGNFKTSFYKTYTVFIAPVWEEFVFRALPFAITALFVSNPFSFAPAAVTVVFGIGLFTAAHAAADGLFNNAKAKIRTISDIFYPSVALTLIFNGIAFTGSFFVPWYAAAGLAYAVAAVVHALYNGLILKKFMKGTALSIAGGGSGESEEIVSESLERIINELEIIFNKTYERDRIIMQINSNYTGGRENYARVLDNLRKALPLDRRRQYEIAAEELSALFKYINSSNIKNKEGFYKKIFLDVKKALQPVSGHILFDNGQNTLRYMLDSALLDILIKEFVGASNKSYAPKSPEWNAAVSVLSNVSENMPLAQKSGLVSRQLSGILSSALKEERLAYILFPLSFFTVNETTGEPFFHDFMRHFKSPEIKSDEKALRLMMYSYFLCALSLNFAHAFDIIKLMSDLGLLKTRGIPYEISRNIGSYEDVKNYYLALSEPGADEELAGITRGFLSAMGNIKLSDEKLNKNKEESLNEIRLLTGIINASTAPILEYQANRLLSDGLKLLEKEDENGELMISALIPVLKKTMEKSKNIEHVTFQNLFYAGGRLYGNFGLLRELISFFFYATDVFKDENVRTDANAYDYIYRIIEGFNAYNEENTDKAGLMYAERKNFIFSVLRRLARINPESREITFLMFNDFGFNADTLSVIAERPGRYVPSAAFDDLKIDRSEEVALKLIELAGSLNLNAVLAALYRSSGGKQLSLDVIDKLYSVASDASAASKERAAAAGIVAEFMSSFYGEIRDLVRADIESVDKILQELGLPASLVNESVFINSYDGKEKYSNELKLSPLVNNLPRSILPKEKRGANPPVYFYADGRTDKNNLIAAEMRDNFSTLKDILVYNDTALRMLINLNGGLSGEKIKELLETVMNMAEGLKEINREHGEKAVNDVKRMLGLNMPYGKAEDSETAAARSGLPTIADKQAINSLINEIHQLSIRDFMAKVSSNKDATKSDMRVLNSMQSGNTILAYDLSDSSLVNKDIRALLVKLAGGKISLDNLVFMDDILVWSTKLFAHSVDVFFNFGEIDRGININYTESNFNRFGNFERLRYFAKVLSELGFHVTLDMNEDLEVDVSEVLKESEFKAASLKAVFNKDSGLTEESDMAELAFKTIMLFRYSIHVNHMFNQMISEGYAGRDTFGAEITSKLAEKFIAGEIWHQYDYEDENAFLSYPGMTERVPFASSKSIISELNGILKYLKLKTIPSEFEKEKIDINIIRRYFNEPLERAFADGKIVIDESGELKPNEDYDMIGAFLRSFDRDALSGLLSKRDYDRRRLDEMFLKSRTVNLVGKRNFSYRTMAFLGEYIFVSGYVKINGGFLSVKGIMNPLTGRMKYTAAEFADINGRKELSNDELKAVLESGGYYIPDTGSFKPAGEEAADKEERFKNRYIWETVGERESRETAKGLYRDVKNIDSHEIIGTGTSEGSGSYVAGNINFDKSEAGARDVLVVDYTTPDDIDVIEKVAAVLTTGGGVLSHAAITTREKGKTSATLSSASINRNGTELDTDYYDQSGSVDEINGIKFKRVERRKSVLKTGDRVLINGETGSVLLFNDINADLLNELQGYADANDAAQIRRFLTDNGNSKDIRRFVEYIFFQVVGNAAFKDIMSVLFDADMPENIRRKVAELNEVYVSQRVALAEYALESLSFAVDKNPFSAYVMAENLIRKLDNTAERRKEIEELEKKALALQERIKDNLGNELERLAVSGERIVNAFDGPRDDGSLSGEKKLLSEKDIRELIRINKLAAVYNGFISNRETRETLIALKKRIENVNARFGEIMDGFKDSREETFDTGIMTLDEIFEEDIFRFGSKTTELASMKRLLKSGLAKVPQGVGVSAGVMESYLNTVMREYGQIVKAETGQDPEDYLKLFNEAVRNKDAAASKRAAGNIVEMIKTAGSKSKAVAEFERELNKKIQSKLDPSKRVSVRSSGEGEDKENRAYAGIGDTQLDVGYDEILTNLKETLEAFYSDRSISYMVETGEVVKPAILIQEMVQADKSAVVFSRNKYGVMTVEALYGLGEAIVSGIFNPDHIEIDAETGEVMEYSVADKKLKIVATGKGTKQEIVTKGSQERVFNNAEAREIASIVKALEDNAGYPIDVELSLTGDGTLYILQRRPITTNIPESMKPAAGSEAKHGIAVISGDVSAMTDKIVDMKHPGNDDETVTFYRVKIQKTGNKTITVLMIDEKYAYLMSDPSFAGEFLKRLNEDKVVNKRLNPSLFAKSGRIEFVGAYYDRSLEKSVLRKITNSSAIAALLAAA